MKSKRIFCCFIVFLSLINCFYNLYAMLTPTTATLLPQSPFLHTIVRRYSDILCPRNQTQLLSEIKDTLCGNTCLVDDHDYFKRRALHIAIRNESIDWINALLAYGADPNFIQGDIIPPLHLAVLTRNYKVVACLLESYSCHTIAIDGVIAQSGQTALHLATKIGILEIIILLLSHGASINKQDNKGKTALDYTIDKSERTDTIDLLEKNGAVSKYIKKTRDWCLCIPCTIL